MWILMRNSLRKLDERSDRGLEKSLPKEKELLITFRKDFGQICPWHFEIKL